MVLAVVLIILSVPIAETPIIFLSPTFTLLFAVFSLIKFAVSLTPVAASCVPVAK